MFRSQCDGDGDDQDPRQDGGVSHHKVHCSIDWLIIIIELYNDRFIDICIFLKILIDWLIDIDWLIREDEDDEVGAAFQKFAVLTRELSLLMKNLVSFSFCSLSLCLCLCFCLCLCPPPLSFVWSWNSILKMKMFLSSSKSFPSHSVSTILTLDIVVGVYKHFLWGSQNFLFKTVKLKENCGQ